MVLRKQAGKYVIGNHRSKAVGYYNYFTVFQLPIICFCFVQVFQQFNAVFSYFFAGGNIFRRRRKKQAISLMNYQ